VDNLPDAKRYCGEKDEEHDDDDGDDVVSLHHDARRVLALRGLWWEEGGEGGFSFRKSPGSS
jgi:hypothetical protein